MVVAVLVGVLWCGVASASTVASGSCGVNGDNLTWSLDDAGTLTISGSGEMKDYTSTSDSNIPWYTNRTSIQSVNIVSGVTNIGKYAFSGCNSLTSITIPDSVTTIGFYAFYSCKSLTSITIPDNVTIIGDGAFRYCTNLRSIGVSDSNACFASVDDILYSFDMTVLIWCPPNKQSVQIPDCVTKVGNHAFENSRIQSLTLPNSVTSIGDGAFRECRDLSTIVIPNNVTSIGFSAFMDCRNLSTIMLPEGITDIKYGTFYGCERLRKIVVPDGVTSIGSEAFSWCLYSNLDITIPESVTSIGSKAFDYTYSVKVHYTGTPDMWSRINKGTSALPSYTLYYQSDRWSISNGVLTILPSCVISDVSSDYAVPWKDEKARLFPLSLNVSLHRFPGIGSPIARIWPTSQFRKASAVLATPLSPAAAV